MARGWECPGLGNRGASFLKIPPGRSIRVPNTEPGKKIGGFFFPTFMRYVSIVAVLLLTKFSPVALYMKVDRPSIVFRQGSVEGRWRWHSGRAAYCTCGLHGSVVWSGRNVDNFSLRIRVCHLAEPGTHFHQVLPRDGFRRLCGW